MPDAPSALGMTVVCALFLLGAMTAFSAELIPPGSHPKISAGAGQTVSRGPSSLFYNPANLIFAKFIEPQFDIAFASVTYTYQHTDVDTFAPAIVKVNAPPVTIGATLRPVPMFAAGFAFVPTGTGSEQLVNNVPVPLAGAYQLVNISNKQSSYKLAAGGAVRFAFPITVGFGLIRSSERFQTLIFPVDENGEQLEDPLIDAVYGGAFNQFAFGARSEIIDRALVLAFSFRTGVQKKYVGDVLLNISEDAEYEPIEAVGFSPATIGVGAETRFGSIGLFVDFVREQWSGGRAVFKRGLGPDKDEVDFIDTNNIGAGVKFWLAPKHMLEAAFGMVGANIGDGNIETTPASTLTQRSIKDLKEQLLTQDEGEEAAPTIAGPSFGSLEAIPRTTFSGGYRAKIQGNGYFQIGAHFTKGQRLIPEGLEGEGLYSLSALLLGVGIAYGF